MSKSIYVWDIFVRIFHWALVLLFITSYLTGEEETIWHIYSGYTITVLVLLRIVWGFIGTRYARFSDFVRRPVVIKEYARGLMSGNPKHYLGHNPLGGAMVVALLCTLLLTTFSGMKLYAVEEGKGPFAAGGEMSLVSSAVADEDEHEHEDEHEEGEDFWEEIHETGINIMLLLIILHISGVVISSRVHRESLVKAMLTGYKQREE